MQRLNVFLMIIVGLVGLQSSQAQSTEKPDLPRVSYEVPVSVSEAEAWAVLSLWGNFAEYHAGVNDSKSVGAPTTGVGAVRVYHFGKSAEVTEQVILWKEGKAYSYRVTDSKGFPFAHYEAGFGLRRNDEGQLFIGHYTHYKAKPGFLTGMMKGSLRQGLRKSLLAMKHYMETGEKRKPLKELDKTYKEL